MGRATGGEGFSIGDHLLLAVIDHLAVANWQRANEGQPRAKQTKPPAPVRRPGEAEKKYHVTSAELRAFRRRTARTTGEVRSG